MLREKKDSHLHSILVYLCTLQRCIQDEIIATQR